MTDIRRLLHHAGVRPTPRRVALGELLYTRGNRHVSAEELWDEARGAGLRVSLATVYNTLNGFLDAGLLTVVVLPGGRSLYDTNTGAHHHVYDESTGAVRDLPAEAVGLDVQRADELGRIVGVDVLVRVRS